MNRIYLETARVRLRQYEAADFERMLELDSDPEVMRYLTGGRPSTLEEVRAGTERMLLYQRKYDDRLGAFLAELQETGEIIGWFHLRPDRARLDDTQELELGYRLKRQFWGRGYATEVSRALVRKAFEELGAQRVFAQALATNLASRRVMEKVGLHFERELADPQDPPDSLTAIYRLSRDEWRKSA
jgi:RimJ/RimL family protein N-acetyltransferase